MMVQQAYRMPIDRTRKEIFYSILYLNFKKCAGTTLGQWTEQYLIIKFYGLKFDYLMCMQYTIIKSVANKSIFKINIVSQVWWHLVVILILKRWDKLKVQTQLWLHRKVEANSVRSFLLKTNKKANKNETQ